MTNKEIHSKLGPAFMYTIEVVKWFETRIEDHPILANNIHCLFAWEWRPDTIEVEVLREYLHNHGWNAQAIMRELECDVTQYQNFA